ncbi:hypothetical protein [Pareuzebyella sediminis]|uniref:hypothetical protein n=1 Tax=Pareuzebyella sediminis TaxID=2607998 RepID=UPI0011EFBE12|nr:hypothetical protein [Pareuzebyella sediminis]
MDKTELSKFYRGLLPVLWEELFFYIPDNKKVNEFLKGHEGFDYQKYRGRILVLDRYEGPVVYEEGRNNGRALLKGASLKDNIHQLLKKKADSDAMGFDYALTLYLEQVECLFYICNWLEQNLDQVHDPLNDTVKGLFRMQYDHFKAHLETLLQYFYPEKDGLPKGNFDLKKVIAVNFPDLSKKYTKTEPRIGKLQTPDKKEASPLPRKKAKKPPLITEIEAETALLKRIFKID